MAVVALVGRPNVGKSALFNRLTQTRRAIVEDVPGVTRDRLYQETEWNGVSFQLVDTGGLWVGDDDSMLAMVRKQTEIAIAEADLLAVVVDGQTGLTAADEAVVERVRRAGKPFVVVVNKAEAPDWREMAAPFYALGGEPVPVSALHGAGVGELLDVLVERLATVGAAAETAEQPPRVRVAIVGRPNVGKSSLVNRLVGNERTLVTPLAGTTRDVVDTPIDTPEGAFLLLDTAGLRRPARVAERLEEKTVARTVRAIKAADVVLLLVEAITPVSGQDQRIAGMVERAGKAVMVLVNKADLVRGTTVPVVSRVREALPFLDFAPVRAVSAATGWHLEQIWPDIRRLYEAAVTRVPTHVVNQVVQEAVHLNPPPTQAGKALKIYYATQVGVKPPQVVCFVNDPRLVNAAYVRYLERRLRERCGYEGSPLRIGFRSHRPRPGTAGRSPLSEARRALRA